MNNKPTRIVSIKIFCEKAQKEADVDFEDVSMTYYDLYSCPIEVDFKCPLCGEYHTVEK